MLICSARTLDYATRTTIHLTDGTGVELYGKAANKPALQKRLFHFWFKGKPALAARSEYYYIPPAGSVRLSKRADGTPEFMFMKYTTDEVRAPQGGLLHFLVEWGLKTVQERELEEKLREKLDNPRAKVIGCVPVKADYNSENGSFKIISGTLSNTSGNGFRKSVAKGGVSTN